MSQTAPSPRERFLALLRSSVSDGTLVKLTLGKHRGSDPTLRNVFVRPVELKSGPRFSCVWRHTTRDVTKNLTGDELGAEVDHLLGRTFLDAHLFTTAEQAQIETQPDGTARLRIKRQKPAAVAAAPANHDRSKARALDARAGWLRDLGVTNDRGQPREGMADKYRQIQKFAEVLSHLLDEAFPPATHAERAGPLHVVDMGCGKGYLTFAVAALLGDRALVQGIEARPELVTLCNRVSVDHGLEGRLRFTAGTIADTEVKDLDVLIALHACDTATDDALAKGVAAGARLLVVAPCCQKELRPQLVAPPVLAPALQHGIFQERQAEFVTDALRAQLLEWAGYRTKVFEFISTEHTARNVMIAAIRGPVPRDERRAHELQAFAQFYGIRTQTLATLLGLSLAER
jgi:SAM-dependent methyltransferase